MSDFKMLNWTSVDRSYFKALYPRNESTQGIIIFLLIATGKWNRQSYLKNTFMDRSKGKSGIPLGG